MKTLEKKGAVRKVIVVNVKEIVSEQVLLAMENSAMMKNIADATEVLNFSPITKNFFDSMLP